MARSVRSVEVSRTRGSGGGGGRDSDMDVMPRQIKHSWDEMGEVGGLGHADGQDEMRCKKAQY